MFLGEKNVIKYMNILKCLEMSEFLCVYMFELDYMYDFVELNVPLVEFDSKQLRWISPACGF